MMMLALSLSLSVVSPLWDASHVASVEGATPAPRADREVALHIDYQQLLEQEGEASVQDTVSYIRQDGLQALREQHGVEVIDGPKIPAIIVTLSWVRHDESVYGVSIETRRPGEEARTVETFECECIDSGLTKAVLERLPAALAQLDEPLPREPEPEPDPVETSSEPSEPTIPATERDSTHGTKPRPLGKLGKAGIGLLVTGAAGVVSGGVVFAQRQRLDNPSDPGLEAQGRDFQPPGIAVMVTGGVLAATGVALLVVDRVRARRGRTSSAHAWVLPVGTSVALTAKF
jgi:hypothetical protein